MGEKWEEKVKGKMMRKIVSLAGKKKRREEKIREK